jgi:hypothetical protein
MRRTSHVLTAEIVKYQFLPKDETVVSRGEMKLTALIRICILRKDESVQTYGMWPHMCFLPTSLEPSLHAQLKNWWEPEKGCVKKPANKQTGACLPDAGTATRTVGREAASATE